MPRILIAGAITDDGMALLRQRRDVTVEEMADVNDAALLARLPAADALIIRTAKLSAAAIAVASRLRVVSRFGVGYDNIAVDALTARNIPLAVVGDVNSVPVAEHTMFLMLTAARQGVRHDRATRSGDWQQRNRLDMVELHGKTLLVIGLGRIGRRVARLAQAFAMRVIAYDPGVDAATMSGLGVEKAEDLRAALAAADVVTLHAPRTAETVGMIGKAELAAMKRGAILINAARGGLVDEAALAAAVGGGHLFAAALDTFDAEPPPADHPLFALDRAALSPHCASLTREGAARMSIAAARNALAGLDGRLDRSLVVNPSVLALA